MARRKSRRPGALAPHRPGLLTPEVESKLIDATRQGVPVETAAAFAGISRASFMRWLARGRDELARQDDGIDPDPDEQPYVQLLERVAAARELAHAGAVLQLRRLINGGFVVKEVTKKMRDPETGEIYEETTVDRAAPDFRAISWYLERAHRSQWGKDALEVQISGPQGGPVQVETTSADELAERLAVTLHALEYPDDDEVPAIEA
jgi:hypothetical protein